MFSWRLIGGHRRVTKKPIESTDNQPTARTAMTGVACSRAPPKRTNRFASIPIANRKKREKSSDEAAQQPKTQNSWQWTYPTSASKQIYRTTDICNSTSKWSPRRSLTNATCGKQQNRMDGAAQKRGSVHSWSKRGWMPGQCGTQAHPGETLT